MSKLNSHIFPACIHNMAPHCFAFFLCVLFSCFIFFLSNYASSMIWTFFLYRMWLVPAAKLLKAFDKDCRKIPWCKHVVSRIWEKKQQPMVWILQFWAHLIFTKSLRMCHQVSEQLWSQFWYRNHYLSYFTDYPLKLIIFLPLFPDYFPNIWNNH